MNMQTQCGEWKHKKVLGQGGFGQVSLWEHATREPIAIKMCKQMLTHKNLKRWESEVEHMSTLDHPNIVKSSEIPEAIKKHFVGGYPALGMEYCEAGDLRRHLGLPANCCGLPEYKIRDLLGSIGSAVNYLHQKNITHRDLKPENIVLKQPTPNKIIFKIIDLGYAKDLNEQSCYSFVGTFHYLAPEFFIEPIRYTGTVDYWSLGLLAFECITGRRPFYPESTHLFHFISELKKEKKDQHICTERTAGSRSGTPATFSSTIPHPHDLNILFEERITIWLQRMLRLDPNTRGGPNSSNRTWNDELQDILSDKYIRIYNTLTSTVLTILSDDKMRLNTLKQKIEQLTNIPICEQLLLFFDGNKPDCQKKVIETCWRAESDGNWMLYLYAYQGVYQHHFPTLPTEVQQVLDEQKKILSFKQAKLTLCLATNFTKTCINSALSLLESLIAICYSVGKHQDYFKKNYISLSNLFYRFIGKLELFEGGLDTDIQFYEEYEREIYEDEEMIEKWLDSRDKTKAWKENTVVPTEIILRQAQDLMLESIPVKQVIDETNLHRQKLIDRKKVSEKKHQEVLISMKRIDQSANTDNPTEMVKGLRALSEHLNSIVIEYSKKVIIDANSWIKKLVKFHNGMQELTPQMIDQRDVLTDLTKKMQELQKGRQADLWAGVYNLRVYGNKKDQQLEQILNSVPPGDLTERLTCMSAGMKIFDDITKDLETSGHDSLLDDWDFLKDDDTVIDELTSELDNAAIVNTEDKNAFSNQERQPVENQTSINSDNNEEHITP